MVTDKIKQHNYEDIEEFYRHEVTNCKTNKKHNESITW